MEKVLYLLALTSCAVILGYLASADLFGEDQVLKRVGNRLIIGKGPTVPGWDGSKKSDQMHYAGEAHTGWENL